MPNIFELCLEIDTTNKNLSVVYIEYDEAVELGQDEALVNSKPVIDEIKAAVFQVLRKYQPQFTGK